MMRNKPMIFMGLSSCQTIVVLMQAMCIYFLANGYCKKSKTIDY